MVYSCKLHLMQIYIKIVGTVMAAVVGLISHLGSHGLFK